ncbi:hypothetical protein TeGR_g4152 [Tetraparma gracilis]|uniref:Glycosyltransferase family 17 protein n=1 Tax=Tetraparma gracilis TaxID=2962635 RepID=A0ABQ6N0H9_9STRA|nr:hypothetical protein TeGR_g4152 [Tetraparma gracilis]
MLPASAQDTLHHPTPSCPPPQLIDAFIFYNEFPLLSYRLSLLSPLVDKFVLIEARQTHRGSPKPLHFDDRKEEPQFKRHEEKLVHVVVDLPYPTRELAEGRSWENEAFQRNAIAQVLDSLDLPGRTDQDFGCAAADLLLVSDVDEIPDPSVLAALKESSYAPPGTVPSSSSVLPPLLNLKMEMYYYTLRYKITSLPWLAPKLVTVPEFRRRLSEGETASTIRNLVAEQSAKSGWHLSYFGGVEMIGNKIREFAHQEFNTGEFDDAAMLEDRVRRGVDLFGRESVKMAVVERAENDYLPADLHVLEALVDVWGEGLGSGQVEIAAAA